MRISEAVADHLSFTNEKTGGTEAGEVAHNLIERAKTSDSSLELVLKITEPGLLQEQVALGSQNVVIGFKYGKDDGEQLGDAVTISGNNGHRPNG